MTNMKVILQKLTKKSEDKKANINLQEEKIAKLTKKLEKGSAQSFTKDSESEEEEKVSIYIETSDKEEQPKKIVSLKTLRDR